MKIFNDNLLSCSTLQQLALKPSEFKEVLTAFVDRKKNKITLQNLNQLYLDDSPDAMTTRPHMLSPRYVKMNVNSYIQQQAPTTMKTPKLLPHCLPLRLELRSNLVSSTLFRK